MSETGKNVYLKSAWICVLLYVVLFWSNGLDLLSTFSPWLGFLICTVLSVGSLVLSVISMIKEVRRELSFLEILLKIFLIVLAGFFAIFLILFTVYGFLLPEAGIPPMIPLFYD